MAGKLAKISMLILSLGVIILFQGCSTTQTNEPSADLVDTLYRTCVEILADGEMAGSGAFVSSDGYILTAAHCIRTPEIKLEILSNIAGRRTASLIAVDKGHDIALLKIETEKKLPSLPISKQSPAVGQTIYVVGSPLKRHGLLVQSVIASQSEYEYLNDQRAYIPVRFITTMAPKGLSGGNWVNADGEIIGVMSGRLNEPIEGTSDHVISSGIAFITELEAIRHLVETKKHADSPSIGGIFEELWTQTPGFQKRFEAGMEGLVIHQIRAGGPLEKAGLEHENLIVEADGKKIRYRRELMEIIRRKKTGDKLYIRYIMPDNKGTGEKEVVLDSLEENWFRQNSSAQKAEEKISE